MKGKSTWSYTPYAPLLFEVGEIYVCRVSYSTNSIHLEWLGGCDEYEVYYRKRNVGDFILAGKTAKNEFSINSLASNTDYEFYVASGNKKSRVRLARTGESIGTIVNYLHPEDEAYSFSGKFLASPSIIRHPDGYLLASMDVFAANKPQNLTLIYRSDDDGETWHYVSELTPCFWGTMFIHKGELYMLSASTEYGDLIIGKSTDGGKSFSAPTVLMRGSGGNGGNAGFHKAPQNVIRDNGRLYTTVEWGNWGNKSGYTHAALMLSIDENEDLLVPENWTFTTPIKFDVFAPELQGLSSNTATIEGTAVKAPDGKILNIMRFERHGYVIAYELKDNETLAYSGLIEMPTNRSKFTIRYDVVSNKYYSIVSEKYDGCKPTARNLLSLISSPDLKSWDVVERLIDYRHDDAQSAGFQYVDFEIEGNDIIYLSRTALNGADTYHNSNQITFHRIKNFNTKL